MKTLQTTGLRLAAVAVFLALPAFFAPTSLASPSFERRDVEAGGRSTSTVLPPGLPSDPSLGDYLAYAEANSPKLQSAEARWAAAKERASRARFLPDPMVSYGYFLDEVETRVGPQEHRFGIRQTIPWPGELVASSRAASAGAAAEGERLRGTRVALQSEIANAYYEYAYLARAIEIAGERLGLLERLEGVARTKYSAGSASYGDVMKAQIELSRAESELEAFLDLRGPLSAKLASLLNLPSDTVFPWPRDLPQPGPIADAPEVQSLVESSNPELRALLFETEAAERSEDLARTGYFPDLTIGLDYIVTGEAVMPVDDSGKDPLVAVASINLPLWFGKHRASVREAKARRLAAERAREQRANELAYEARMVLYRLHDAERRISLYRDELIPRAAQALKSTETAYEAGGSDFDGLVTAERALLDLELGLARALADRAQTEARLEVLTGGSAGRVPAEPTAESAR